ncbi:MAG: hypothetical protein E6Q33_00730 [Neisseriales bacterium]|nr:MAG: hypothetical protein E6Q33_00730 [Neisseriales bacterium]
MIIFKIIIVMNILTLILIQILKERRKIFLLLAFVTTSSLGLLVYAMFTVINPMMGLPEGQKSMHMLIYPFTAFLLIFITVAIGSMKANKITFKEFLNDFFK